MDKSTEQARSFLPLTEATYAILVSLAEPRHGYGIMLHVAEASGGDIRIGPGTLYGALTKLLEQGLIRRAGEDGAGDERRKRYVLTDFGRRVVELESSRLERLFRLGRSILAWKEDNHG